MPSSLEPKIVDEIAEYRVQGRNDGAAFLVWFLVNFFRVDPEYARDSVCDSINDKGIDGIVVDDQTAEIMLFQAKYRTKEEKTQGDNDLRNFSGASEWFRTPDTVQSLIMSTASEELKSLVRRCEVARRLSEGYTVRLVFLSSVPFDDNAKEYIKMQADSETPLSAWDSEEINTGFVRFSREEKILAEYYFDVSKGGHFVQGISDTTQVIVLPLKAVQLADLKGISDRSLFARNVRFGLGRTRVNRDIKGTILQRDEHRNFLLYHNGITILCDKFEDLGRKLRIENYSIVNGCQSIISFYDNRTKLSDDLLVLAKVVKVGPKRARIADDITYYNNNQNSISMKDLRSNDRIQTELQKQFKEYFGNDVFYKIKRGEDIPSSAIVVDNGLAAQLLLSFWGKEPEPENAHQIYKLFDQNYSRIFHRDINAEQIYLVFTVYRAVEEAFEKVEDPLIRDYKLSKFFFLYVIRQLLEEDQVGKMVLENPRVPVLKHSEHIRAAVKKLAELLVVEFNYYVKLREESGYFDYKSDLKSREQVRKMASELIKDYKRGLVRHPEDSFSAIVTNEGKLPPETLFS